MYGYYRAGWWEWRSWFVNASAMLDWGWWGVQGGITADFNNKEIELELHIGPFKVYFSGGKEEE